MAVVPFDYLESQADADELLEEFGRTIHIRREAPGEPNPETPWVPVVPVATRYSALAVVLPASQGTIEAFDNRMEGGSLLEERLRYVLMSARMTRVSEVGATSIEPKSTDIVEFDGHSWRVLGCTPLAPAGVPVIYPMGVQR